MPYDDIKSILLKLILHPKTACKVRRFSAADTLTLNLVCGETVRPVRLGMVLAENRRSQVFKNT